MPPSFFLSVGSNVQPGKNIPASLAELRKHFKVRKISAVYETDPVGPAGDQKFWNLAVEIETALDRDGLRRQLAGIEARLGRIRSGNKFAPRTLDLDILPAPGYQEQAFIMIPLAEIAPEAKDPESGKKFREIADGLKMQTDGFRKIPR